MYTTEMIEKAEEIKINVKKYNICFEIQILL
jgi:hypothetical protein